MMEMTNKMRILVLYASTYDMLDEKQRQIAGCTIHYLFWGDHGEQLAHQTEFDVNKPVGYQRAKCSIDIALRNKVVVAPAVYEGEFQMSVGSDGKPVLRLKDIAYVCNVEMTEKVNPGFVVPGMVTAPDSAGKGSK